LGPLFSFHPEFGECAKSVFGLPSFSGPVCFAVYPPGPLLPPPSRPRCACEPAVLLASSLCPFVLPSVRLGRSLSARLKYRSAIQSFFFRSLTSPSAVHRAERSPLSLGQCLTFLTVLAPPGPFFHVPRPESTFASCPLLLYYQYMSWVSLFPTPCCAMRAVSLLPLLRWRDFFFFVCASVFFRGFSLLQSARFSPLPPIQGFSLSLVLIFFSGCVYTPSFLPPPLRSLPTH